MKSQVDIVKLCLIILILLSISGPALSSTQLGEIQIQAVEIQKTSDDGYWKWYVQHIDDVRQFNKSLTETRLQLTHLASEILRAKAMRYNLAEMRMEWLAAKDESIQFGNLDLGNFFSSAIHETARVGNKARKSNKRMSKELAQGIRQWTDFQKDLIDKIIKQQTSIYSRAEAQNKKSGSARPALVNEMKRLDQEHMLLPLFMYDYAAWHEQDQLPRLIKDLTGKNRLDKTLELLLTAKAKIADATVLEQKAFTERLRPGPTNKQRLLFERATIKGDPLGYLAGRTRTQDILKTVTQADVYQTTSQTQRLDAIVLLRNILRNNPGDTQARSLLAQQELYWLKRISQKIEGQSKMAMSAFSTYLVNRGFDPVHREGWWPWLKDYSSAIWGLGPISMFAGIPGIDLPGANAELVGSQVMDAAKHRISLAAIMRLVKTGHTLVELRAMSSKEMAILFHDLWGESADKRTKSIHKIAVDVHSSLRQLRDLNRLAQDDDFEFARDINQYFAQNYYTPVDSRYQSFEWFGDLLNVHNIVTLWGPGAIVKVGDKWAKAPYMSFAAQDRLQKAGKSLAALTGNSLTHLLNNQKVLIKGYNLDTIGEMIRKTNVIKWMGKVHEPLYAAGNINKATAQFSKIAASFYLNGMITESAKASGIPGAALITELILSYEIPQAVYGNFVFQDPMKPLKGMQGPLKKYQERIQQTRQLVTQTRQTIEDVAQIHQLSYQALTVQNKPTASNIHNTTLRANQAERTLQMRRTNQMKTLVRDLGNPPVVTAQNGQPVHTITRQHANTIPQATIAASEDALMATVQALRNSDPDEAGRALTAARSLAKTAQADADVISNRVSQAIERLDAPPQSGRAVNPMAEELSDMIQLPLEQRNQITPLIDTQVYDKGVAGEKIRLADEAMRRGDLDTALANLDEAGRYSHQSEDPTGAVDSMIHRRKTLLSHARDAQGFLQQRRLETHDFQALEVIQKSELEQIRTKLLTGDFKGTISGRNPAIEVSINDKKFRIKPSQVAAQVEAEAAGGAIADLLGFDTPSSTLMDARGIKVSIKNQTIDLDTVLVTRSIDDFVPIEEMQEHVLLALRSEYADQRAFRSFLADSDGHMGNIGLGPNGKLWVIDTDLANFGDDHFLRQLQTKFQSEAELVEAAVVFSHAKAPDNHVLNEDTKKFLETRVKPHPKYRWMGRADQMIQYDDMAGMVEKIKTMMASESRFVSTLVKRGISQERAQKIFQVLKQRSSILEQVLNKPSLFGGKAIDLSYIQLNPLDWFSRLICPDPGFLQQTANQGKAA